MIVALKLQFFALQFRILTAAKGDLIGFIALIDATALDKKHRMPIVILDLSQTSLSLDNIR